MNAKRVAALLRELAEALNEPEEKSRPRVRPDLAEAANEAVELVRENLRRRGIVQ